MTDRRVENGETSRDGWGDTDRRVDAGAVAPHGGGSESATDRLPAVDPEAIDLDVGIGSASFPQTNTAAATDPAVPPFLRRPPRGADAGASGPAGAGPEPVAGTATERALAYSDTDDIPVPAAAPEPRYRLLDEDDAVGVHPLDDEIPATAPMPGGRFGEVPRAEPRRIEPARAEEPLPYRAEDPLPSNQEDEEIPDSGYAAAESPGRGTADLGLLVVRVAVGVTLLLHGLQKFGAFPGYGMPDFQLFLTAAGFEHTRLLGHLTAGAEVGAGAMLVAGLLTPIAGAVAASLILVAGLTKVAASVNASGAVAYFATATGGIEYEAVLFAAIVAVILAGPGRIAADFSRPWSTRPLWGSVLWLLVGVAVGVLVWVVFNGTNPVAPA